MIANTSANLSVWHRTGKIRQKMYLLKCFWPLKFFKIVLYTTILTQCLGSCCRDFKVGSEKSFSPVPLHVSCTGWFTRQTPGHPGLSAALGHKYSPTHRRGCLYPILLQMDHNHIFMFIQYYQSTLSCRWV